MKSRIRKTLCEREGHKLKIIDPKSKNPRVECNRCEYKSTMADNFAELMGFLWFGDKN